MKKPLTKQDKNETLNHFAAARGTEDLIFKEWFSKQRRNVSEYIYTQLDKGTLAVFYCEENEIPVLDSYIYVLHQGNKNL